MGKGRDMEIWRPMFGYEESYAVSSAGRVKSIDRVIINSIGRTHTRREVILKQAMDRRGYFRVGITRGSRVKTVIVHREVLKSFSFIENYKEMTVNHINGEKCDNRVENLEWMTLRDNVLESYKTGQQDNPLKKLTERNTKNRKLTDRQVRGIRTMYLSGNSIGQISRDYNSSKGSVWQLLNGRTYKDID